MSRHGIVLVFDEVVTGFRLALGGAQEITACRPTSSPTARTGGGFPIGAYGGRGGNHGGGERTAAARTELPWSASTTGGNPVSSAAALAAIDVFSEPGVYDLLHSLGKQLRTALGQAAKRTKWRRCWAWAAAQAAFLDRQLRSHRDGLADRQRGRAVMLELLRLGVFLNPMGTKLYLSLAHGEKEINELATHFATSLQSTRP